MTGRGRKTYYRKDNGNAITNEDVYAMVMLHNYQKIPIYKIARRYSISTIEARVIIGKRSDGSCCG